MTLPPPVTTTRAQWTLDVTRATVGDHHNLRALAAAHRRAGRHHRELGLLGASRTVQRAALQLGGGEPDVAADQVRPNRPSAPQARGGARAARCGAAARHARRALLRVE